MRQIHTESTKTTKHHLRPVSRAEYDALVARMEDLEDALDVLRSEHEDEPNTDAWHSTLVERMLKGEHPLRLWREHRGLTLQALSTKTGIAKGYLSEIESRKKPGSAASLKKCARVLNVDLADLVV